VTASGTAKLAEGQILRGHTRLQIHGMHASTHNGMHMPNVSIAMGCGAALLEGNLVRVVAATPVCQAMPHQGACRVGQDVRQAHTMCVCVCVSATSYLFVKE
jgi:hypothetical protein